MDISKLADRADRSPEQPKAAAPGMGGEGRGYLWPGGLLSCSSATNAAVEESAVIVQG